MQAAAVAAVVATAAVSGVLVVLAGLLGLADPSVTYSQLGLHTRPGHVDMWTMAESGQATRGRAQIF